MAAPTTVAVTPETPITIKITVGEETKKLKLPLRDLGVNVLPLKIRQLLHVGPDYRVILERYSDSLGDYIVLDENNAQVFKTLVRAAKAKLKLRLKATVLPDTAPMTANAATPTPTQATSAAIPRNSNIGSGIFQFRDARASTLQQPLINFDDIPAPKPFSSLEQARPQQKLAIRAKETPAPFQPRLPFRPSSNAWSVYCNNCDKAMSNEHFHCGICDGGDYDLCVECVEAGKVCPGVEHWLVKRFIVDGKVETSTTERVVRKPNVEPAVVPTPVAAVVPETKTLAEEPRVDTRTCNSCVVVLPDREFVTCTTCDDFDLCIACHAADQHGHHPAHGFEPAVTTTVLSASSAAKLAPGRGVRHNALCDACDKHIVGVRHKCLHCPDWDYCSACIPLASQRHAGGEHRFVAIYDPLPDVDHRAPKPIHSGVRCDGPLCATGGAASRYIQGVRYKCTICHDLDFCAACEAHPSNTHNHTHPLLKMRTPVRGVSVQTQNEVIGGGVRVLGDRVRGGRAASATTQVQTVAEIKPIPLPVEVQQEEDDENEDEEEEEEEEEEKGAMHAAYALAAEFVHDTIPDGTSLPPDTRFAQRWTLKNTGSRAWPAGCSVCYTGGDNMLNIDSKRPGPTSALAAASESNVIARAVLPGEEVAFQVMLKTPVREGRAISYWRVKTASGEAFGHRLWCDVSVRSVVPPMPSMSTLPAKIAQDATRRSLPVMPSGSAFMPIAPVPAPAVPYMAPGLPSGGSILSDRDLMIAASQRARQAGPVKMAEEHQKIVQQMYEREAKEQAKRQQRLEAYKNGTGLAYDEAQRNAEIRALTSAPNVMSQPTMPYLRNTSTTASMPAAAMSAHVSDHPAGVPMTSQQREYQIEQLRLHALRQQQAQVLAQRHQQMELLRQAAQQQRQQSQQHYLAQFQIARQHAAEVQAGSPSEQPAAWYPGPSGIPQNVVRQMGAAPAPASSSIPISALLSSPPSADKSAEQKPASPVVAEDNEEPLQRSAMVFPKLDKESPSNSTYQSFTSSADNNDMSATSSKVKAAYVENEKGEVEETAAVTAPVAAAVPTSPAADSAVLDEEIEVLSATGEEEYDSDLEDGEGFATDEEYDILDASDEETVA